MSAGRSPLPAPASCLAPFMDRRSPCRPAGRTRPLLVGETGGARRPGALARGVAGDSENGGAWESGRPGYGNAPQGVQGRGKGPTLSGIPFACETPSGDVYGRFWRICGRVMQGDARPCTPVCIVGVPRPAYDCRTLCNQLRLHDTYMRHAQEVPGRAGFYGFVSTGCKRSQ